jgi:predicted metal-dependent phosphotriesterase family hydrolase
MDVLTLTINLPRDVGTALENKARVSGKDSAAFVEDLVAKEVNSPTFDEILAPFRQNVKESGMTEEELDTLFTEARREVFKAKKERENR